jgi:hypothetical protein
MSDKQVSVGTAPARATNPAAARLPDLNAQTYPFNVVLHLLDQAAYFNVIASPDLEAGNPRASDFEIHSSLHTFETDLQVPVTHSGMRVKQVFGEAVGTFRSRWLPIRDDFVAGPGLEPPQIAWDRSCSQRFVMQEATFLFGDGQDGFRGFGTGRTFPTMIDGQNELLAGAIGTTLEGFGRFWGLEGTYVCNGIITPETGFRGNIAVRILDPKEEFRPSGGLRPPQGGPDLDPGATYLILRGNKKDASVKSEYDFAPDGSVRGLLTPAEMRAARYRCAKDGRRVNSKLSVGPVVGTLRAVIYFDLLLPPGTAYVPAPFTTDELYQFVDDDGKTIGTIKADVVEGESFGVRLPSAPGQPAIRFAGYGAIREGTGVFEGLQGMLSVNSAIGIAPHALSLMHIFRIIDPDGKYIRRLDS